MRHSALMLLPLGSLVVACPAPPPPPACQNGTVEEGELCLGAPSTINLGFDTPLGLTAADINQDGNLDLLTSNVGDKTNSIRVDLGNGDGTFQAPQLTQIQGQAPVQTIVGDLNEDQKPDLAVPNFDSNNVSILIGNGDGTFVETTLLAVSADPATGSTPFSAALGDLNQDGHLDLAVTEVSGGNTLDVFLGNGDGTFAAPTPNNIPGAGTVKITDMTQDQILDLVATSAGGDLLVFPGNGDGTFAVPVFSTTTGGAFGMDLADFNGDGLLDAATSNFGANQGDNSTFSVAFGNGDGTFDAPSTDGVELNGGAAIYTRATDLNQDGAPDLIMTSLIGGTADLALNQGDGTFAALQTIAGSIFLREVAAADFNKDGAIDLAIASDVGILLLLSQP